MKRVAVPPIGWIVTALPTAVAVLYLALVWLPNHWAITAVQDQAECRRQFVVQAGELPAIMAGCQRELDAAQAAIARWEKAAPRKKRLAEYFEKIDSVTRQAGLAVTRFDPQPFVVHEKIHEIPLLIDCSGGFAQVYEFLRNVERLPATIWVDSIKIENIKNDGRNVTCKVNLVGFSAAGAATDSSSTAAPSTAIEGGALCPTVVETDRPVDRERSADHAGCAVGQDARPLPNAKIGGFATVGRCSTRSLAGELVRRVSVESCRSFTANKFAG